jgi:hypothetical protein
MGTVTLSNGNAALAPPEGARDRGGEAPHPGPATAGAGGLVGNKPGGLLTMGVSCALLLSKTRGKQVKVCAWCGSCQDGAGTFFAEKLIKCGVCKRVWYCGRKCAKNHKSKHERTCEASSRLEPAEQGEAGGGKDGPGRGE